MSSKRIIQLHFQLLENSIAQLAQPKKSQTGDPSDMDFIRRLRQLVAEHLKQTEAATDGDTDYGR